MKVFLGLLLLLLTVAVIALASFGIRWVTASPKGKLDAREQILSGDSRIQGYEHFFNLCASVQANEGALNAQFDALVSATTQRDKSFIQANIAGLTATRASGIAQYNVDARKSYTTGQFRASDLPYQLPAGPYSKEMPTSCEV